MQPKEPQSSKRWRIRIRRRSGLNCDHFSDEACEACEADKTDAPTRLGALLAPAVHTFHGGYFEHMYDPWERVPEITSREQLRQECEKQGVYAKTLQDSMHFAHGPKKWF